MKRRAPRPRRHANSRPGPLNWRWSLDRQITSQGYVRVRVGKTHPLADSKGAAYEHEVVWIAAGRTKPRRGWVIHHLNGRRDDNRLENLALKRAERHSADHVAERVRDRDGRFVG